MIESEPQLIFNHQADNENIRVWQQDNRRWLDFDDGLIQSEILLDKPEVLPLTLNRAMLAGMMFVESPKKVLLAGTGGGVTARYFAKQFQNVKGDAIEISDVVITIAQDYFDFPINDHWKLISKDIVDYVSQSHQQYDVIIVDIALEQKTPEWLIDRQFLQQCRALLTEKGHMALNLLVDDANSFLHYLSAIREVFDCRTACLSLPNHRNIVIFAFNQAHQIELETIESSLLDFETRWGLEFTEFYQQMLKDNPKDSGLF